MGSIISKRPELDSLLFRKLRIGRKTKVTEAVQVDGCTAVLKLADGTYSVVGSRSEVNGNVAIIGYGCHEPSAQVLHALVALGAIPKTAVKDHLARVEDWRRERDRKSKAKRLRELCEELGVAHPVGLED